jgi:hypothetical protein
MNRHDPGRADSLGEILSLTLVDDLGLIDLIDRTPTLASSVKAMFDGFGSDLPPQCGSCGVNLTWAAPPHLWGLVQRGPKAALFGVCFKCSAEDTMTITRTVLAFFRGQLIEQANLHVDLRRAVPIEDRSSPVDPIVAFVQVCADALGR